MLRAAVTLSRKLTRDYNSNGFSVTLDGEIPHATSDAEGVLERVSELFHLAEEALQIEIGRNRGESNTPRPANPQQPPAIPANANPPPPSANGSQNGTTNRINRAPPLPMNQHPQSNGNGSTATPKQIQFLQTMARRHKLDQQQLTNRITEIVGRPCPLNQLSKKEAGLVLDQLTYVTH